MPDYQSLIPVTFVQGEVLTADTLNNVQKKLVERILTHTHTDNATTAAQGVQLGGAGIKDDAIEGRHIKDQAVASEHIAAGAVKGGAISDKAVEAKHLAADAVTTNAIKAGNVTRDKLAPELAALFDSLGGGASTYGWFAFLDGAVTYPVQTGNWWDWAVDPAISVAQPRVPIYHIKDDGNWLPTYHAGVEQPLDQPITYTFTDRVGVSAGTVAIHAATVAAPAAASTPMMAFSTTTAVAEPIVLKAGTVDSVLEKCGLVVDYLLAQWGQLGDDLLARKQLKVDLDTDKYPGLLPGQGKVVLNPGAGGVGTFCTGEPIDFFVPPQSRTYQHWAVAKSIAYHLGIEDPLLNFNTPPTTATDEILTRLYDVLAHPERLLAGYWTGPTQNVRSAVRMQEKSGRNYVRVRFAVPYASLGYAVQVTPDYSTGMGMVVPVVLRRQKEYVDIAFWNGTAFSSRAHFSLAIVGELNPS